MSTYAMVSPPSAGPYRMASVVGRLTVSPIHEAILLEATSTITTAWDTATVTASLVEECLASLMDTDMLRSFRHSSAVMLRERT